MRSLVSAARQEACKLCLETKYINGTMDTVACDTLDRWSGESWRGRPGMWATQQDELEKCGACT